MELLVQETPTVEKSGGNTIKELIRDLNPTTLRMLVLRYEELQKEKNQHRDKYFEIMNEIIEIILDDSIDREQETELIKDAYAVYKSVLAK